MQTRKRSTSTIPFGWELHPEDSSLIQEIPKEQETLEFINTVKDNYSLRVLARIIEAKRARKVTARGMKKILDRGY